MAKLLTEKAIDKLTGPRDVSDAGAVGLYLRVTKAKRKIWRYRANQFVGTYTDSEGQERRRYQPQIVTLGDYPALGLADARDKARELKAKQTTEGTMPRAQAQMEQRAKRKDPPLGEFIDVYIKRFAIGKGGKEKPHRKSWNATQLMLHKWTKGRIDQIPVSQVTTAHIRDVVNACGEENARQDGKLLAALRTMYKWAVKEGHVDVNPCLSLSREQPQAAKRAMTHEEVRHLWEVTGEALESDQPAMQQTMAMVFRLCLLTGQRPGEVAQIQRDQLHMDNEEIGPFWICPGSVRKSGRRGGDGKAHFIPLEPEAVQIIEAGLALSGEAYVFPKATGGPHSTSQLGHVFKDKVFPASDWNPCPTPKDARKTVATEIEELDGFDEHDAGCVLGHASASITGQKYIEKRVNDATATKQRARFSAWEARLMSIVSGKAKASNVIRLHG